MKKLTLILITTILLSFSGLSQERKMKVSEEIDTINVEIIKLQNENKNLQNENVALADYIYIL